MMHPDQSLALAKSQLACFTTLGRQWLDCGEQLAALQLGTGKSALKDCAAFTHELMAVRSPEHLWSVCGIASGPALAKADAYGRQLHEILCQAWTAWSQFSADHAADIQRSFSSLLENAGKNIPQAPGTAAALLQQWIAAATSGMESTQKAAMHLAEVADANWTALSRHAGKPE
ncbi:MAG: hypothetical protein RLZZ555_388 [Pseudomonadota bacterium]|jgi:Phasin protein